MFIPGLNIIALSLRCMSIITPTRMHIVLSFVNIVQPIDPLQHTPFLLYQPSMTDLLEHTPSTREYVRVCFFFFFLLSLN
jgi:hypothetical protein